MKRMYRRQRRLYIFTGIVATIGVINLLFLVILYQPARSDYFRLRDSIGRLRAETANRKIQIGQKENVVSQLETSNQARFALLTKHLVPFDQGFALVYPEFDRLARQTGVRWTRVDSNREVSPTYGLYSVTIKTTVQGGYPSVVSFIKQLEDSETFYIIDSVDVRSGDSSPQSNGMVSLALGLETYFYK